MTFALTEQPSLFGQGVVGFDATFSGLRRIALGRGAWIDHLPAWVQGHEALFEGLWTTTRWRAERREMYEHRVDVPRLVATLPDDGPGHPVVAEMAEALSTRYGTPLREISLAAYRDGRDSVAFHGDRIGRQSGHTVVAIVSLGAPRRFLLRPAGGGTSRAFDLGWGDLLVMGGTCQRTWEHAVPKMATARPRMSVQFRPQPLDREEPAPALPARGAPKDGGAHRPARAPLQAP